jgi:hypothetical protein
MKEKIYVLISLIVLMGFACRNQGNKNGDLVIPETDTNQIAAADKLSFEAVEEISGNISSPVEIANLLQTIGVPFSPDYLASGLDVNKLQTSFSKAVGLGILGADLGYLNMYERTGSSIETLSSIRKLADAIRVGQFFDFEALKRLSLNKSNLDSLLFISIDSYSRIDKYLRESDRGQLSALMITGVWIEGQYLATQVMASHPDPVLRDRIGEQKIILNDLLLLLDPWCGRDSEFKEICSDLQKIREAYSDIKISYRQGDPVTVEKNGGLIVTQTETSIVEMSDEQLSNIIQVTKTVRDKLISGN